MSEAAQVAIATGAEPPRNEVFYRFPCWTGKVPEGSIVNFLGVLTRADYWEPYIALAKSYPVDQPVKSEYPAFDEEYFEWVDLLESVVTAKEHFTMIELGAGWGRWTANAAVALKHLGDLPHTFIAVEAEPSHFQMMIQHLADNGLVSEDFKLIQAAITRSDGKVGFQVGETESGGPTNYYGHSIGGSHMVDAVSLTTLLQPFALVDLIDLDVQGAEFEVLEAAAGALDDKVKKVHIGTHGWEIEDALRSLFGRLGWRCLRWFPGNASVDTEWGAISFCDGVQTWLNPAFSDRPGNSMVILAEKLAMSRQEGARLWAELKKVREERSQAHILEAGSTAWKVIARGRTLRDRLAPGGTQRRRMLDFIARKM